MSLPVNADRWFTSSVNKYFATLCSSNSINFKAEDSEVETETWREWVELYINGPSFNQLNNNEYLIELDVDLLVTVRPAKTNFYRVHEITGLLTSNMQPINIYKFGDGDALLACLKLDFTVGTGLRKIHYGIDPDTKMKRAGIIGSYELQTIIS